MPDDIFHVEPTSSEGPIPHVMLRRTFNLGNYENIQIGVSVPAGDWDLDRAADMCGRWINDRYAQFAEVRRGEADLRKLEEQIWHANQRVKDAKARSDAAMQAYRRVVQVIRQHGGDIVGVRAYGLEPYSEEYLDACALLGVAPHASEAVVVAAAAASEGDRAQIDSALSVIAAYRERERRQTASSAGEAQNGDGDGDGDGDGEI